MGEEPTREQPWPPFREGNGPGGPGGPSDRRRRRRRRALAVSFVALVLLIGIPVGFMRFAHRGFWAPQPAANTAVAGAVSASPSADQASAEQATTPASAKPSMHVTTVPESTPASASATPSDSAAGSDSPTPTDAASPLPTATGTSSASPPASPTPSPTATITAPPLKDLPKPDAKAFIAKILPLAQAAHRLFGVPVSVTIAQAMKESRDGTSRLATESNALFGMKCHPLEGDRTCVTYIPLGLGGVKFIYASYPDWAASVGGYARHLSVNPAYGKAMADAQRPLEFARDLSRVYSPDAAYGESLIRNYMLPYNLQQYDQPPAAN